MSDTYFVSKKISQAQVVQIIAAADYDPNDYTYAAMVDKDGYTASGDVPMATSRLEHAAKKLNITVEIFSGPNLLARARQRGDGELIHAGNGNGRASGTERLAAAASAVYSIDFTNDTNDTWTFAVYQTLPSSPGLKSLSWKQTTVPRGGESGVQWTIEYLVAVLKYQQAGGKGVYKSSQKLGTSLGDAWEVVYKSGAQQLAEAGSAPTKGQVTVANKSGQLADIGIGMDGDVALVQPQVFSGAGANFEVEPTYWVAMYKDIVKGEVISGAQVAGPIKVKFFNGATAIAYRAWTEGGVLNFGLTGAAQPGRDELFQMPIEQALRRAQIMRDRELLAL